MAETLTPESLSWFLFGGAVFFLMGLALAFDAEHHSQAALDWERLALRAPQARRGAARQSARALLWAYRLGGAAFAALGLCLAAAAERFPRLLLSRFRPVAMTHLGRVVAGLFLILAGMMMSTLLATSEPSRGWGRRVSFWSAWLLILTFLGFGVFLLARPA